MTRKAARSVSTGSWGQAVSPSPAFPDAVGRSDQNQPDSVLWRSFALCLYRQAAIFTSILPLPDILKKEELALEGRALQKRGSREAFRPPTWGLFLFTPR
jgi:hypothetical protein